MSRLDDLTDEQRAEVEAVVKETLEWAHARLTQGRSSMPITVDNALLLAGMAAAALHESEQRLSPGASQ